VTPAKGDRRPAVVVDGVSKRFRLQRERAASLKEKVTKLRFERKSEFWALSDVSFAVPSGSMFALVGHNGSGKSTMLRVIAGIYRPTSGRVTTHGRISALLELGAGFHGDLTGRENIYLNSAILGMTRRETDRLYDSIVEFSGLEEFIDTPVRHYSSGMYVRLGFSVAVHVDPQILMVDEVIAVGDADFQRRCYEHFYKLRNRGTTIVMVTHGLGDVKNICDEAAWLDHGALRAVGPASEIVQLYLDEVNQVEADRHEREQEEDGDEREAPTAVPVAIERVQVLGRDGSPLSFITPHEPCTLSVDVDVRQPVVGAKVRFQFATEHGITMSSSATDQGGELPAVVGRTNVRYEIPSVPFAPGDYLVSVDVVDADILVRFDFADRVARLRVRSGEVEVAGLVRLDGAWQAPTTPLPLEVDRPV
jgi:lipopolysaccharide transport system ATP-binding protein